MLIQVNRLESAMIFKMFLFLLILFSGSFSSMVSSKDSIPEPGSIDFLDYKNGFRNIHFGDGQSVLGATRKCSITAIKNSDSKMTMCSRKDEFKKLLSQQIGYIKYEFYDNKLFRISIRLVWCKERMEKWASGVTLNSCPPPPDMYSSLKDVWGEGKKLQKDHRSKTIVWTGKFVEASLKEDNGICLWGGYRKNTISGCTDLVINSINLLNDYRTLRKASESIEKKKNIIVNF